MPDLPDTDGVDIRVAAALAAIGGVPEGQVAAAVGVEPVLVARWASQFLDGGRNAVTNRPSEDEAARRDRFLTLVSHELRTPLSVLVAAGGLLTQVSDDPVMAMLAGSLLRATTRLEALADQFGETAAATLGRLQLEPEAFDLGELAATTTGRPVAGSATPVHFDPARAATLIGDLVIAAADDTADPDLDLAVRERDGWGELAITRRPGLAARTVAELLDPFDVADDATAVTFGLYRARALAVAGGGQLGASGDDDHTTFWVRLPLTTSRPLTVLSTNGPGALTDPDQEQEHR